MIICFDYGYIVPLGPSHRQQHAGGRRYSSFAPGSKKVAALIERLGVKENS